jgi:hypothetical protein
MLYVLFLSFVLLCGMTKPEVDQQTIKYSVKRMSWITTYFLSGMTFCFGAGIAGNIIQQRTRSGMSLISIRRDILQIFLTSVLITAFTGYLCRNNHYTTRLVLKKLDEEIAIPFYQLTPEQREAIAEEEEGEIEAHLIFD